MRRACLSEELFAARGDAGGAEGPDEHEGDRRELKEELEARGESFSQRRATRRGLGAGCMLRLCARALRS